MSPEWMVVAAGLERIAVPGGWLFRTFFASPHEHGIALAFVPVAFNCNRKCPRDGGPGPVCDYHEWEDAR